MRTRLHHPLYGDQCTCADGGADIWTNVFGVTYVSAYWGPWRTFASVPATEVVVRLTA